MISDEFRNKVAAFKRELVRDLLNRCQKEQITFFNQIYGGIEKIEEKDMESAYIQCKNTLRKNNKTGGG